MRFRVRRLGDSIRCRFPFLKFASLHIDVEVLHSFAPFKAGEWTCELGRVDAGRTGIDIGPWNMRQVILIGTTGSSRVQFYRLTVVRSFRRIAFDTVNRSIENSVFFPVPCLACEHHFEASADMMIIIGAANWYTCRGCCTGFPHAWVVGDFHAESILPLRIRHHLDLGWILVAVFTILAPCNALTSSPFALSTVLPVNIVSVFKGSHLNLSLIHI